MSRLVFALAALALATSDAGAEKVLCQRSSFWIGDYLALAEQADCPAEAIVDAADLPGLQGKPGADGASGTANCKLEDWLGGSQNGYSWCKENGGRSCVLQVIGDNDTVVGCQVPFHQRPHHLLCCGG